VQGKVTRIELPGGEWIEVKERLNAGERRDMFALMRRERPNGLTEFDSTLVLRAKFQAYILGWSFSMIDGADAPITPAAFDALDEETFDEIRDALAAHEAAIAREVAAKKNSRVGGTKSDPISPSAA